MNKHFRQVTFVAACQTILSQFVQLQYVCLVFSLDFLLCPLFGENKDLLTFTANRKRIFVNVQI